LPEWLLSAGNAPQTPQAQSRDSPMTNIDDVRRRASSPVIHCGTSNHTAEAWLRSGGASKASRFTAVFIDILRLLATEKLCIWSVEDIQNSDPESAELISHIVKAKIPLILIFTYQNEQALPKELRSLLTAATKIELSSFTEEQTADYVAETLHRDREYILPLVAVVQEKSNGNLFYIREILDSCYRKKCVFYSWKQGCWVGSSDQRDVPYADSPVAI
jgi:predicted ATPase